MRSVISAIMLIAFLVVLVGNNGAKQNILATAAVYDSLGDQRDPADVADATVDSSSFAAALMTEEQYVAGMTSVLQSLGDNTLTAYQLNEEVIADPSLLADDEWLEQIEQTTIRFSSSSEIVRQAAVPSSCLSIHEQIRFAVDHYDRCVALYTTAIDNTDLADIEQCNRELQAGYFNVRLAEELLAEMQANVGAGGDGQPSTASLSAITGAASIVTTDANLRSGPATSYDIVGGRSRGDVVYPMATNEAGDWVQLDGGEWIAGWLLDETPAALPVTQD